MLQNNTTYFPRKLKSQEREWLFTNLDEFTDEQLVAVLLIYNRHWKRVELDHHFTELKSELKKKSFIDIFKK